MNNSQFLKIPRFFRSIFTKLIVISLLTWIIILVSILATFIISRHDTKGPFYKNSKRYIEYIVEDIGSPPVYQKAMQLSAQTGMHITFVGKTDQWTTRDLLPNLEAVRFRNLPHNDAIRVGRVRGHHYLSLLTEHGTLYFEFAGAEREDRHIQRTHLILLGLLSLAVFLSYLAIKRILLPLKWLNSGVQQVKEGNLQHLVPLRGNDELTDLVKSFNEMTAQLRDILATKEHLLRDVSHELRSPLTRIRVALELIEDAELQSDISADIDEMEEMIRGILETAKEHHQSNQQVLKKYNLAELIYEVTGKYASSKPHVSFNYSGKPLYSLVDSKGLRTVLTNCIENGIKFSKEDSKPVEVELSQKRRQAVITITDHGEGIDEEELRFIFEPFYRVDSSRSRKTGGYGLGLAICKAIVEAHGGTMKVFSQKGEGTRILFTLDLSK